MVYNHLMSKVGFDNAKYIRLQSQNIARRVAKFNKLYLEFGGKLFDDNHASRVLPGFEPDSKIKMLLKIKDKVEIVLVINANDIEKYKGMSLYVTRENAVPLKKDEYFMADLIGLEVINEDDSPLGELTDVMQTGANDVYIVKLKDGGELLLPAIKQCILEVDINEGFMKVHLLEGLM